MNRYWAFRQLLDFMADHAEVTNANLENFWGKIEIGGEDDEHVIKIEVSITDKEA